MKAGWEVSPDDFCTIRLNFSTLKIFTDRQHATEGDREKWKGCVGWAVMGIPGVKARDGFAFVSIIGSILAKYIIY